MPPTASMNPSLAMLRNRRRSSSSSFVMAQQRRSSVHLKDVEYMQAMMEYTKKWPSGVLLAIMTVAPLFVYVYHLFILRLGASPQKLLETDSPTLLEALNPHLCNLKPWMLVSAVVQLQLIFHWFLPSEEEPGVTEAGHHFISRRSSFSSCLLLCLLYAFGVALKLYDGNIVIVNWPSIMIILSAAAFLLQLYVHVSSRDTDENSGDEISDAFYGRNPRPVILDLDVKSFITHRIALTFWALYVVSAAFHHYEKAGVMTHGFATMSLLQLLYVWRRQWFEYVTENDCDRAGFYRLWGVMVFLPTLYLTPLTLLAQTNAGTISRIPCAIVFLAGLVAQYFNSDIDLQRHTFRKSQGRMKIRTSDPYYITAKYRKDNGEVAHSLLLGSGYWGMARHFNYPTEFFTFLAWTLPMKFPHASLAYLPVILLAFILYRRTSSAEIRCLAKYGQQWMQYANKVPNILLPGVY